MRTRVFLNNSISTAILQIITMISGFIIPKIMLTEYGSEINGLVTSISQFLAYFNIIEAGFASAAVFSLYKPIANKNNFEINSILSATKGFYYKIGRYYLLLVLVLALIYPLFIKVTQLTKFEVGILIFVLGCSGALNFFLMSKYRVLLTATQKIYILSFANISYIVLNTLIIAVMAFFNFNIIILKAVALCSVFLRSLILYIYVKKNYKYVRYDAEPNINALSNRWDAMYQQILGSIQSGAPVIIATFFTSLKQVSVFSIYNMVFIGIYGVLSIFSSGLSSSFGDVIARGEKKTLQKAYNEFEYSYYMIISIIYACILILIMPFIKIYTHGITDIEYYYPIIGFLFTLNGLLYNLKTPQGMIVISAGMYKETRIQVSIQGLIIVIGSIIFVQFWGLTGILLGMCLSNLYRTLDLLFFVPRNITSLRVSSTFLRMIRVFVVIALCYLPFIFISIETVNFFEWFVKGILIFIYSTIVTVTVNFIAERDTFNNVLSRIFSLYKKKKF